MYQNSDIEFERLFFGPTNYLHPSSSHARIQTNLFLSKIFFTRGKPPPPSCVRPTLLDTRFARDDIEIMRAMPEAARHKRAQLLEHKSAGRNSSRPRRPIHAFQVVETWGFHRDRERWKPFDESRLRIYGGSLLKRSSSLSHSLSLSLLSFYSLGLESV